MSAESSDTSGVDDPARPRPERDNRLDRVGHRAQAAGLGAWWTQFRNPATGEGEGPVGMRVALRSGRRPRSVHLSSGEGAAALLRFRFERWTVLHGYEAILDPEQQCVIAAVTLRGTILSKIPGAVTGPPEEAEPVSDQVVGLRVAFRLPSPPPGPSSLTITGPELRERGYRGSATTLRTYLRPLRAAVGRPPAPRRPPKTRQLTSWLLAHPDRLADDNRERVARARAACPRLTPWPPMSRRSPKS